MIGWQADKRWSDRFLTEIKRILGEYLICEPPVEEDAERNTDLIVLRLDAVRIACRMRKYQYAAKYGDEFTIRAGRPSGVDTELTKIIKGWGDYFFYGFSDAEEKYLAQWMLGDLKELRLYIQRELVRRQGVMPGQIKRNVDGSSDFIAFKQNEIPRFVIASAGINQL